MMDKDIVGIISILATVGATIPYLWKSLQGKIHPHLFTWIIWCTTTGITAAARMSAHAGPGAWAQWAGAVSCLLVAIVAIFRGERNFTRSDVLAFVTALAAIPVWLLTDNPLYAAVIVTFIDVAGYYPTFRKTYNAPYHEAIFNYVVANIVHVCSLIATQDYNVTTLIFPSTLFFANAALISFIMWRRQIVARPA